MIIIRNIIKCIRVGWAYYKYCKFNDLTTDMIKFYDKYAENNPKHKKYPHEKEYYRRCKEMGIEL
jgi:hypothetical protein